MSDSFSGGNELDSIPAVLSGSTYDATLNEFEGDWIIPATDTGLGLELLDRDPYTDGTWASEMNAFDFVGTLPGLGDVEFGQNGAPDPNGSTTFSPPDGNGNFTINSFFDIFVELSLNGGNLFIQPNSSSPEVFAQATAPEPGTTALGFTGLIVLAGLARRRMKASGKN